MRFITFSQTPLLALTLLLIMTGCAGQTHLAVMSDIERAVQTGEYDRAEALLQDKKELQKSDNQVLYLLESGVVAHLNGKYAESNQFFETAAQRMTELDVISVSGTAADWLLTEKFQAYRGEDYERVLVHYYMALNYIMLGDLGEALVECRRVNELLDELNRKYEQKNVYKTDAFMLYLSGILYDAEGGVNDALIDYRKAYETYHRDYQQYYGTVLPAQLPAQLLRTTAALGFQEEFESYRQAFPDVTWANQQAYQDAARLVIIWNNGLMPFKVEQIFRWLPDSLDDDDNDKDDEDMCYIKMAFAEFRPRPKTFARASVTVNRQTAPLDVVENIAGIATKNLEDRRLRTMAQAVSRNILKCVAEHEIKKSASSDVWVWLFRGVTEWLEGADVRHWFLLPADVHLTQMLLPPGEQDVELSFLDEQGHLLHAVRYEHVKLTSGETTFLIHRTF